jgi:hypothetical protein
MSIDLECDEDQENYNISIQDIIDRCKKEFGEEVDLNKLRLNTSYQQYACFGYDLYDSGDYMCYTEIKYKENK